MKQRKTSIDGFISRRPQRSLLNERSWQKTDTTIGHMRTDGRNNVEMHSGDGGEKDTELASPHDYRGDVRQEIGQSLKAIDADPVRKSKKNKKPKSKKRKIIKIVAISVGVIAILAAAFFVYKAWQNGSRIFQGDLLGIFQQQELKMDAFGRSNLLIVGSTDDDPDHPGGNLTDSMMVVSVDQKKKDVFMFSIPRDLYVQYDKACMPGYAGKINAYYACVDEGTDEQAEKARMDGIRKLVGGIFDMDIQYAAHVNTAVIRDSVNAVGGITVDVQSRDPRGVLDGSMDWMCWAQELSYEQRQQRCPTGHYIDLKNGPNKMDGDKAMWFSRARGLAAPTYGLEESNFDREKNQQLVLMALKDKATSTGTLTDITKVMGLMDAMGKNLRTNIDPKEIQTVMRLGSEIDESAIHRLSFVEEDNLLMTTGNVGGQSIVQPAAGLNNYSDIQAYIKNTIYATPLSKEGARVAVLNAGGVNGAAQEEADKLADQGLQIALVGNAPQEADSKFEVYKVGSEPLQPLTRQKLEEVYGATIRSEQLPFGLSAEADFVVLIGASVQ